MKNFTVFILVLLSFGFNLQQEKDVFIYGSNACDHCINLKKALDSAEIEYTFYDIDVDKVRENEMVSLLNKYKRGGHVTFPVAEVDGKELIIGANFDLIIKALDKQ